MCISRKVLFILPLFLLSVLVNAQSKKSFQKKYALAQLNLKEGKPDLAYTTFLELTKPNEKNEYERISHYFCGLSAINAKKLNDANFILSKALTKYTDWSRLSEVKYLLAIVYFERIDYARSYQILNEITGNKLKKDVANLKTHYLLKAPSIEVLYDLLCENEEDKEIPLILANKLNYFPSSHYEKDMLEFLIQDYKLDRTKYTLGTHKVSVKKQSYDVALLLPFKTHKTSTAQLVKYSKFYEMYEGIKMAIEDLRTNGIKINLHTYDTKRDSATIAQILSKPEILKMDLLIGPIYNPMATMVAAFAGNNQINYINPLFTNNALIAGNENAFLLKPSYTAIGKELATYASENFIDRDVLIFYGSNVRDSIMAYEYHHVLDSNFASHINFFEINRDNVNDVQTIIKTEDSDLLSHIFVASTDRLMAANLMSAIEEMNMHVPVIAPSKWLDTRIITYEQFKHRHFFFYYDDYINYDDPIKVIPFREKFETRMNIKPHNRHAYIGYDCIFYWGQILHQHGNLFNEKLKYHDFMPGITTFGFEYKEGNTNDVIPLLYFNDSFGFDWMNPPK